MLRESLTKIVGLRSDVRESGDIAQTKGDDHRDLSDGVEGAARV